MPIIEVAGVGKEFRLGELRSLKHTLLGGLARLRGRQGPARAPFKALDEVSFAVEPGEVLGIIGHNGAGKSTLLKLLAGITKPTRGTVRVAGKVAPLIEVGAGLVPDLTGRENIFLNAAILGMRRAEIARKFDEIVAFAELEEFIDTPIKRYSSGMQVRLGFSIATSVEADILIVDEVLAVGDLAFQRKCFERMEDIIKRQGRTVLMVSHNIRQIERMCLRAMLLDHGRVLMDDAAATVCDAFFRRSNEKVHADALQRSQQRIEGTGEAKVLQVELLDRAGQSVRQIRSGDPLRVRVTFELNRALAQPELIVGTHTTDFVYLTGCSTAVFDDRPDFAAGTHRVECTIESYPLVAGTYCVRFVILDRMRRLVLVIDSLEYFSVLPGAAEAREEGLRMINVANRWLLHGRTYSGITGNASPARELAAVSQPGSGATAHGTHRAKGS